MDNSNLTNITIAIFKENEEIIECTSAIPKGAANLGFILSVIIIIVGLPGNLLTILALLRSDKLLSNATTIFVINLAVADVLFCSINLPMTSIRFFTCSWPFGKTLCIIYPFLFYGNVAVSLLSITCITINRLILIAFGSYYKMIYKRNNIRWMIVFCWIFSFGILLLPMFHLWGQFGECKETFSCTILKLNGTSPKKILFLFGFLLPSITIIICYSIIWCKVKQQTNKSTIRNKRKTSQRGLKLTKLITVIFLVFVLCFAPTMISNVFFKKYEYPYFQVISSALSWFNSCINPFIYFAMNRQYRRAFTALIKIKFDNFSFGSIKSNLPSESTFSNA